MPTATQYLEKRDDLMALELSLNAKSESANWNGIDDGRDNIHGEKGPLQRKIICFSDISYRKLLREGDDSIMKNRREASYLKTSDFDGTIFHEDTGHLLFDAYGCGPTQRAVLTSQLESGERSFKEVSEDLWASLNVPFSDGFSTMQSQLSIDSHFQAFHKYCMVQNIPFHVISAGLKPVLRKVLDEFLGEEESARIDIVANDARIKADGGSWKPLWRHGDSELGHDKARSVREARELEILRCDNGTIPLIVFIGDGVSDLPAAREADVLFARKGLRLEEYCKENKIPYVPFEHFGNIQKEVERLRVEDERVTGGSGIPARFNPRANMWRRVSSKAAVSRYLAATPTMEEKMFLWPDEFSELKKGTKIEEAVAA